MAEELRLQIEKFMDDFDKDEEGDLISFTEGRVSEELPESFKIFLKDLVTQLKKINWSADIDTADLDVAKTTIRQLYRQKKENLRKKLIKKNKKNVPPPPPPPTSTVPREELLHRLHQKFKKPTTVSELNEMNLQRAVDSVNNQLKNTGL